MEPKFRFWDTFNGEMIYSDEFAGLAAFFIAFEAARRGGNNPVLMQGIGLEDKNGKHIYKNDIDSEGRKFNYDFFMGSWYLMKNGEGVQWHCHALRKGRLPIEIVGNPFQNPELLPENTEVS